MGFYSNGIFEAVIPVTPAEYQADVSFIFEGSEIGRQIFFSVLAGDVISEDQVSVPAGLDTSPSPNSEHGSLITEADLEIPAGYKIAAPIATHEVTGDAELTVELVRQTHAVKVNFTENGVAVGSQMLSGLTRDAEISALDLVVPSGCKIVSSFADYVVVGDAEISVAVAKPVTDPDGVANPDGGEGSDGTIDPDPDTVTKSDVKPTTGPTSTQRVSSKASEASRVATS
ncbi:hypothetical protein ICM05_09655 [Leucobacter sp. cx-42]|uniref:hypothetical protein n=1 Tax=unclassified Leucobacter TaxID=2621730 RepID=UPI00165E6EF5|nr:MULTISPECIES: hypothetical protein [unclassified Leucobacter]MBC9954902.1 hypothetical protein [Leucobacter sp. cx-42]